MASCRTTGEYRSDRVPARHLSARAVASRACLLHECCDEPAAVVGLGMPLDAEREAAALGLQRLRELVELGPAGDDEAVADTVHALVMVGLRRVQLLAGGA